MKEAFQDVVLALLYLQTLQQVCNENQITDKDVSIIGPQKNEHNSSFRWIYLHLDGEPGHWGFLQIGQ
jgi:hypothetical protein